MSFKKIKNKKNIILLLSIFIICGILTYLFLPKISPIVANKVEYDSSVKSENNIVNNSNNNSTENNELNKTTKDDSLSVLVTHIETPDKVKALYMSSWVAGSKDFRTSLIKMIDETELNSVVIDIKDSTGRIAFGIDDPVINQIGSVENRIRNIREVISLFHSKDIYVIGRISVFQDPYLTKVKPEWAIRKLSDGGIWKDRKGLSFLDPTNKEVYDYTLRIAKKSYEEGFDEINFDYIRYPSDGNIKDINYNLKEGETRADNIEKFFKFISSEIKKENNIPISGDVFGLTTESNDDMGIGQVWTRALPYFDYLCPMVYPSHYPKGHAGYTNPALYPYEVIDRALESGVAKSKLLSVSKIAEIRPWLQDFDLGATYTKDMVRAQIKAVYDNGLDSWMLWDPSNRYTPSALLPDSKLNN